MKKNTATIRVEDSGPGSVVHPSMGRSGQESGIRDGMVEAVNGISVCFTCQQVGHINRNCPMRMGQVVSDGLEEAQARREDKRRREEDKNEFLSALSEAVQPTAFELASALKGGGGLGAEAKAKKLPAFLAVKKRRPGEEAVEPPAASAAAVAADAIVPGLLAAGGNASSEVSQCSEERETSGGSAADASAVPAENSAAAGTGIGLCDYDSSGEDEEDSEEH